MSDRLPASGPETIEQVAAHFLMMHDDLLRDDEDVPDVMDEATAVEIVRREYVSGTCGALAVALHDMTGWPIVGINGGMHVAVRSPDGMILDHEGLSSLRDVLRRYGMVRATVLEWTRDEAVAHVSHDGDDGPWSDLALAAWVARRGGAWTAHVRRTERPDPSDVACPKETIRDQIRVIR